jgi:hypothetical protein
MTYKMYGALVASVGVVALVLAGDEALAGSQAGPRATPAAAHSMSHRSFARSFRHHRRNDAGFFWPGDGFYDDEPSGGEPGADIPPPASGGDVHYTYKYDVPWDWAHRYPPSVTPSDRPYVPSCPAENVTVPGHDGKEQTVSITRCY